MIWLLSNWRLIAYGGLVLSVFSAGLYIRGRWDESTLESALKAQEKALHEECAKQQKMTQEISNALQTKLSASTARYNAAVRELLTSGAKPLPSAASSGHDASADSNRLYYTDARAAWNALGLAATAERQTSQLEACQEFVRSERR